MGVKDRLKNYFDEALYYSFTYKKTAFSIFMVWMAWNTYENRQFRLIVEENTKVVQESSKYGIVTTDSYIVKGFEKQKITDIHYKFVVAQILSGYLVKSQSDLLINSGGLKSFKSWEDMFKAQKGSSGFIEFYQYYINGKSENKDYQEKVVQGKASFTAMLQKFNIMLRRKEIPIIKDTLPIKENDIRYVSQDNIFSIEVDVYMKTAGVTMDGIQYKNIPQVANIKAKGYIDAEESHPILNPLGIKFYELDITPVTNPKEANAIRLKGFQQKRDNQ